MPGRPSKPPPDAGRFAHRLDHLFSTVHPASGPYSYEHVVQAIEEQSAISMTPNYLWRLRMGQRRNPAHEKIAAIASFFSVPVTYFYDDKIAAQIDDQLELLAAARDAGLKQFAGRTAEMSAEEARQAILNVAHLMIETDNGKPPPTK